MCLSYVTPPERDFYGGHQHHNSIVRLKGTRAPSNEHQRAEMSPMNQKVYLGCG